MPLTFLSVRQWIRWYRVLRHSHWLEQGGFSA